MYRVLCFIACVAFCKGTAVLPVIVTSAHVVPAPILSSYGHGYAGIGLGHGLTGKHLGHHILKRSPHLLPVDGVGHISSVGHIGAIGHEGYGSHGANVAPLAAVAPVAVSHQARVDIHSSPVIAPVVPVVKAFGPILTAIQPKPHFAVGHHGLGHIGQY